MRQTLFINLFEIPFGAVIALHEKCNIKLHGFIEGAASDEN